MIRSQKKKIERNVEVFIYNRLKVIFQKEIVMITVDRVLLLELFE